MVKASLIICLFGLMICLQSMEIENVVKDVEIDLGDSLSFIPEYSSSLAYSSASYSDKPLPIRVSAKIKFKANTTWYG